MEGIVDDFMQEGKLISEGMKFLGKQEGMRPRIKGEIGPARSRDTSSIVTGGKDVYKCG